MRAWATIVWTLWVHCLTSSCQCMSVSKHTAVFLFLFFTSVCRLRCDTLSTHAFELVSLCSVTFCPSACTPAVCALQGIMGGCIFLDPCIVGDVAFEKINGRLVFLTFATHFFHFDLHKSESGTGVFLCHPWSSPPRTLLVLYSACY